MILKAHGLVIKGRFAPEEPEYFKAIWPQFDGKRVTVSVSRYKKPRSNEENRYYWGVVINMICEGIGDGETAEAKENIHETLKSLFLTVISYRKINGKQVKFQRVRSTTELSTLEMEEYLEKIRRWAAQFLGIIIPEPNQCEI